MNTDEREFRRRRKHLESVCSLNVTSWLRLRIACATMLLLTLPPAVQAQYIYTTNNGAITITGYTGPGGAVTIPSTITGLPATTLGDSAFANVTSLMSITIPNSVTSMGNFVFTSCYGLTNAAIGVNQTVVVEVSTTLTNPVWSPVATNTLTGGSAYFSDAQWTNYPARFYRLRSP